MTWLEDTSLRDLDESVLVEATCMRCSTGGLHYFAKRGTSRALQ